MKRSILVATLGFTIMSAAASADILSLTVDNRGTVALGGTMLLISGTYTCSIPYPNSYSYGNISGAVMQIAVGGKVVSQASGGGASLQCSGPATAVPFTFQLNTYSGSPFKPGRADATVNAYQTICDYSGMCTTSNKIVTEKINLNP